MSEILKVEAVVISKMNYGDTSKIVNVYTKEYGKVPLLIKGARDSKSKIGKLVDPLNLIQCVIYKKPNRELQYISSADLINHFPRIKDDYDSLKYSFAVLELLNDLTIENEVNSKVYNGVIRILNLFNDHKEDQPALFGKFFLFFIKEIGYEIQFDQCYACGSTNLLNYDLAYNYESGLLCSECKNDYFSEYKIDSELFLYLISLKNNLKTERYNLKSKERAISFMEKFLMFHIEKFKGLSSLKL